MNNLIKGFNNFIKKERLFQSKDKLLLAVSGGVDSVVLCDICAEMKYDFIIAHCNFQLRGEESNRDEEFVETLSVKYNVPLVSKRFDTVLFAEENKYSMQVAARHLRYDWFKELMYKDHDVEGSISNPEYLVTAHHANDNIETLLMNFFKGTGINGLKSIAPKNEKIVRPLLFATKEELISYAREKKIKYVEDSSNISNKYTRNYFRNELIPGLQKVFPMVENNLQKNIDKFRDIELLYNQSIQAHILHLAQKINNEVHIPVLKFSKIPAVSTVMYEIIRQYGFSPGQVDDVLHLLKSETGKFVQSHSFRIIRNRKWLIISPLDTSQADNIIIEQDIHCCQFGTKELRLKTFSSHANILSTNENSACFSKDKIVFPLLLRKYKKGDYFYPLGMQKKKKLSKFFIDNKLSLPDKEQVWVLESGKRIIWVVGMRIDDRYKVTDKTKEVLKINLIENRKTKI